MNDLEKRQKDQDELMYVIAKAHFESKYEKYKKIHDEMKEAEEEYEREHGRKPGLPE